MSKRVKFFLTHLAMSALIAGSAMALVLLVWYPAPLAKALGVIPLLIMMLVIDIFIGPLFGFMVYKEGKKTLKMDLAVVIVLQLFAFGFGLYSVAQGRPAWLVYGGVNFDLVKNSDIETANIGMALPEFQHPSWTGPKYVNLKPRTNMNSLDSLFQRQTDTSTLSSRNPVFYESSNLNEKLKGSGLPLNLLEKYNDKTTVDKLLKNYPKANAWVGLNTPMLPLVVLIDNTNGDIIKIVDLRPWE